MENNTWIKLFRKFREWEWYQDSNTKDLFLEILLTANTVDKKWHGIDIKRGQLLTSRIKLSNILGISEQSVRTSLTKLKSTNEITIKSTNRYTLITVNKFNDYQQLTNKLTNNQPTTNQQLTTTKECKERKNAKEIIQEQNFISFKEKTSNDIDTNVITEEERLTLPDITQLKIRLKEQNGDVHLQDRIELDAYMRAREELLAKKRKLKRELQEKEALQVKKPNGK